ncbi:vitrin-like [Mya arenaria]|uniref:vitrin-like n=1 Tax=Mya arenaria TaxID=6604 RepID=UPI0022E00BFB|nr:vitrin-like [Mya arenaria]
MDTKLVLILSLCACLVHCQTPKCNDIDTQACHLLAANKPDLCQDAYLSKTACPRFCKLCPIECHQCNATVLDYNECNTTMLCAPGEICMLKELKSWQDGHHEYEMTCTATQSCDGGSDLVIPFGKRDLKSRDLSVTCCDKDLCNYPSGATPTQHSTGCPKDVVFLIDESSTLLQTDHQAIVRSLTDVARALNIGPTEYQVGLYGYSNHPTEKFDLDANTYQNELVQSIQQADLLQRNHFASDASAAVEYLVSTALTPQHGDRAGYPDSVVIITDPNSSRRTHLTALDRFTLENRASNIMVVSVGGSGILSSPLEVLGGTIDHVHSSLTMDKELTPKLLAFLQHC